MTTNLKPKRVQPLQGKTKRCQKCKRENESEHHLLCPDCWEKKKYKDLNNAIKEFSKRKEANNNKAILDVLNLFKEFIKPTTEKMKIINHADKNIKRTKVWEHNFDSGDYFRVFLLDKPIVNDVDDIEVEMNGVYGTTAFAIQDWEAMALAQGLMEAVTKKYGNLEKAKEELIKQEKIIEIKGDDLDKIFNESVGR